MRPGLGSNRIAFKNYYATAATTLNSGTPVLLYGMQFEVTEAGMYMLGAHFSFRAPGNSAANEACFIYYIDGQRITGRTCDGMYNNTVQSRMVVRRTIPVYLCEGQHAFDIYYQTVGSNGQTIDGYGSGTDSVEQWVDRL